MKRACSLLAIAAATACAPEPPTLVITRSKPEAPAATVATPPARPNRPKGPVDLALPEPVSEPSPAIVSVPVSAAPDPTPAWVRDPRPTSVAMASLMMKAASRYVLLIGSMPRTSPDRPQWILGAADANAEVGRALARDPARANMAYSARRTAIYYYHMLVNDYPTWCAVPDASDPAKSTGCADQTLYYLALEQERDGDIPSARWNYSLVIRDWPKSPFVPSAHLAFGEMFLAESDTDPSKLPLAEPSYLEALKYPPPDNTIYGYAQMQLGQVCSRRGDRVRAIKAFQAAIAWAGAYPAAVGAGPVAVAAAAREALVRNGVP